MTVEIVQAKCGFAGPVQSLQPICPASASPDVPENANGQRRAIPPEPTGFNELDARIPTNAGAAVWIHVQI